MTTATEYRQYARECMDSARDATSAPVRDQFLELAKLWLTAAVRMDTRRTSSKQTNSKGDGHAPANFGVAGLNEQS
jgi:hypothetical protein